MKSLISILLFLSCLPAYSSVIFSVGYNMSALTTNALNDQDGNATGNGLIYKLGFIPEKQFEVGIYNSSSQFKTDVKHDGKTAEVSYEKSAFGVYATYYRKKLYFEIAYGKSAINEKLTGELNSNERSVLTNVYDIHSDTLNGDEGKMLVGLKAFQIGDFVTTLYMQKTLTFSSTHQVNTIGLELKVKI